MSTNQNKSIADLARPADPSPTPDPHKVYTWEQAADNGWIECILSGSAGIYVPREFAQSFVVRESSLDEAMSICAADPDHADYWECWAEILDNGTIEGKSGAVWNLWQDSDLFAIRADVDIDPDSF